MADNNNNKEVSPIGAKIMRKMGWVEGDASLMRKSARTTSKKPHDSAVARAPVVYFAIEPVQLLWSLIILERATGFDRNHTMENLPFTEDAEFVKLNAQVLEEPEEFEHWEKLVRHAEALEGGLNRNSSPGAINATRQLYDRFLARFPLFFGYWKKYADLEFAIAGPEAAEMVYERGVASIGISVDLWANYCGFKIETSHDVDLNRELFERAAASAGLDFLAHPFWDKYIEFEERLEAHDNVFAILDRVIHIPLHQYQRYFDKYRAMAQSRPVEELAPAEVIAHFRQEVQREAGGYSVNGKSDLEIERDLRMRIDALHVEINERTRQEVTKRWTFEAEVKRPYFHVTELDEPQLVNWRRYLDFEEIDGNYTRAVFLYERCVVTCASYDEFWFRYARWMLAQSTKQKDHTEEVRNIYQRASCIYVPISRPAIRLYYAAFEEAVGRIDVAIAIHEAILLNIPSHVETIISLASLYRRQYDWEAAVDIYKRYISTAEATPYTKGLLVADWARQTYTVTGDTDAARQIFQSQASWCLDSRKFWSNYLQFELELPSSPAAEPTRYQHIKAVYDDIRHTSHLPPDLIKDLGTYYLVYLKERGGRDAMQEYMQLDREINGPFSVARGMQRKLADDGREATTLRRLALENGHPGVEVDEAVIRQGGNPYTKYYQQQGEVPNGQTGTLAMRQFA